MKFLILAVLFPSILAQYVADMGMKPDVTFGDHNDRFDLSALMQRQNKYTESSEDFRRQDGGEIKIQRRSEDGNFGYQASMESDGGTQADFEENLKKFKVDNGRRFQRLVDHLHGNLRKTRRSNTATDDAKHAEKEVLMHYAVPIDMTIDGYFQAPSVT